VDSLWGVWVGLVVFLVGGVFGCWGGVVSGGGWVVWLLCGGWCGGWRGNGGLFVVGWVLLLWGLWWCGIVCFGKILYILLSFILFFFFI
jgi:hypothetical protein